MKAKLTCGLVLAAVVLWTLPAQAGAAGSPKYKLTLVARTCAAYTDVMANRARNNLQQSLRDLGRNTVYSAGQPISPAIEAANDPGCTPLTNWTFTLGDGVDGLTQYLSTVTHPNQSIATQASVPELDPQGNPTGGNLAGAVTVTLTQRQADLAQRRALWVQGGTVADPLNDGVFGAGTYAFAALRCGIDDLNGDNVEWVGYPSGVTHLFCYYYAVTPSPGYGTIKVVKALAPGTPATATFPFHGNVSYNPGGVFDLTPPSPNATATFSVVRAAVTGPVPPWEFTEDVPPGWNLSSLNCASQQGSSTFAVAGATVHVTLGDGDTATCIYTDALLSNSITVAKETTNRAGGPFAFTVKNSSGTTVGAFSATTTSPGDIVTAGSTPNGLPPGQYTITETLPPSTPTSSWQPSGVSCDGVRQNSTGLSVVVTLGAQPLLCTFTNADTTGSLALEKTTLGGVGTATFVVTPQTAEGNVGGEREQPLGEPALPTLTATTTQPGVPVLATGADLSHLPLGTYEIEELPPPDGPEGTWQTTSAECSGAGIRSSGAVVTVSLTVSSPSATCSFVNQFDPSSGPTPVGPVPGPPNTGRAWN